MFILERSLVRYGLLLLSYLLGSIPWGIVLTRIFAEVDLRRHGSGNIGATNVARVAGASLGVVTLAGDVLKGWLPVYLMSLALAPEDDPAKAWVTTAALLAVGGHLFPLYTWFRGGGKGVATAAGGFAGIAPSAVLVAVAVFLMVLWLSRRVSAASLSAAAVLPFALYALTPFVVPSLGGLSVALLIFMRHRANIHRLLAGTEPEFRVKRD